MARRRFRRVRNSGGVYHKKGHHSWLTYRKGFRHPWFKMLDDDIGYF